MPGKYQGEPLKPDHILVFCQASFLMTLSWAGFLTLAPGSCPRSLLSSKLTPCAFLPRATTFTLL